ncbi:hypothetical protein [Halobacteriovorax sp.]|uniref:hypothetical protein n=1 Tax=Halobacteriovorax sp. TaxID=2020862 RepID=UPI003AF2AB3B
MNTKKLLSILLGLVILAIFCGAAPKKGERFTLESLELDLEVKRQLDLVSTSYRAESDDVGARQLSSYLSSKDSGVCFDLQNSILFVNKNCIDQDLYLIHIRKLKFKYFIVDLSDEDLIDSFFKKLDFIKNQIHFYGRTLVLRNELRGMQYKGVLIANKNWELISLDNDSFIVIPENTDFYEKVRELKLDEKFRRVHLSKFFTFKTSDNGKEKELVSPFSRNNDYIVQYIKNYKSPFLHISYDVYDFSRKELKNAISNNTYIEDVEISFSTRAIYDEAISIRKIPAYYRGILNFPMVKSLVIGGVIDDKFSVNNSRISNLDRMKIEETVDRKKFKNGVWIRHMREDRPLEVPCERTVGQSANLKYLCLNLSYVSSDDFDIIVKRISTLEKLKAVRIDGISRERYKKIYPLLNSKELDLLVMFVDKGEYFSANSSSLEPSLSKYFITDFYEGVKYDDFDSILDVLSFINNSKNRIHLGDINIKSLNKKFEAMFDDKILNDSISIISELERGAKPSPLIDKYLKTYLKNKKLKRLFSSLLSLCLENQCSVRVFKIIFKMTKSKGIESPLKNYRIWVAALLFYDQNFVDYLNLHSTQIKIGNTDSFYQVNLDGSKRVRKFLDEVYKGDKKLHVESKKAMTLSSEYKRLESIKGKRIGFISPRGYNILRMEKFNNIPVLKKPSWESEVSGYISNENYMSKIVGAVEIHYEYMTLEVFEMNGPWFNIRYDGKSAWVHDLYFQDFIAVDKRWVGQSSAVNNLSSYYPNPGAKEKVQIDRSINYCSGFELKETTVKDGEVWLKGNYGHSLCGENGDGTGPCQILYDIWIKEESVNALRGC